MSEPIGRLPSGRYRFLRETGRGAMATVHLARQDSLDNLPGGSLKDGLEADASRRKRAIPAELVAWLAPIARAPDFLHAEGVVHRDVKPANVLFDAAGSPYLSDSGGARGTSRTRQAPAGVGSRAPLRSFHFISISFATRKITG